MGFPLAMWLRDVPILASEEAAKPDSTERSGADAAQNQLFGAGLTYRAAPGR